MSFLCDRELAEHSNGKGFDLTVQLTTLCNQSCPYCFARGNMDNAPHKNMYISREDFLRVVGFCEDNRLHTLRLTGGEPLLHPMLAEFIGLMAERGLKAHIFSNFTVPDVLQRLDVPNGSLSFLVNVNDRSAYGGSSWSTLKQNIGYVLAEGHRVVLGCNIFELPLRIDHVIELAAEYGINALRLSPANPIIGVENKWLGRDSLEKLGKAMGALVRDLRVRGIKPMLDCPIPFCIFPGEELAFLREHALLAGSCGFGVLVGSELSVSHCFVTQKAFERRYLEEFSTTEELRRFVRRQLRALEKDIAVPQKCSECSHFASGSCCGGCWGLRCTA